MIIPPFDLRETTSGNIFPITTSEQGVYTTAEYRFESRNTVFIGKRRFVYADKI